MVVKGKWRCRVGWHEPRRTAELRKGRVSLAGAKYFVTCAAVRPCAVLVSPSCTQAIRMALERLQHDHDMRLLCATTMPDHFHSVFELTERLTVGQVVGKFKASTRAALQGVGARWQRGLFEHRLRAGELVGHYARYLFLNPYRDGLIARAELWPHWILGDGAGFDFLHQLDVGRFPPQAWLDADLSELCLGGEDVGEAEK